MSRVLLLAALLFVQLGAPAHAAADWQEQDVVHSDEFSVLSRTTGYFGQLYVEASVTYERSTGDYGLAYTLKKTKAGADRKRSVEMSEITFDFGGQQMKLSCNVSTLRNGVATTGALFARKRVTEGTCPMTTQQAESLLQQDEVGVAMVIDGESYTKKRPVDKGDMKDVRNVFAKRLGPGVQRNW